MRSLLNFTGITCALLFAFSPARAAPFVFSYSGSFETFTVGVTGTYQIIAAGAQGGAGSKSPYVDGDGTGPVIPGFYTGGRGAEVGGDFLLTKGEQLEVAVGGRGENGYDVGTIAGGGGGGSFVITSGGTPLVIAGGGGGGGSNQYGGNGRTESSGGSLDVPPFNTGFFVRPEVVISGGVNGSGGGSHDDGSSGSGGAGFYGDGAGFAGGKSYPSLSGGFYSQGEPAGGYGGGGSGAEAGGGGGGYSGGAGGFFDTYISQRRYSGGQGGGSFLADGVLQNADLVQYAGFNEGSGFVSFNLISTPTTVPLPPSAPMFGAALLALGAVGYGLKRKAAAA